MTCLLDTRAEFFRYAAPPVGDFRFRKPAVPRNETGVVNATEVQGAIRAHE
jgi:carboxylesterase type B